MKNEMTQRRAAAGGEFGANGEWYEGGKFIATKADTIKQAPMRHEVSAEELARRAQRAAEQAATVKRLNEWLAARAEKFASVLVILEAPLLDQWGKVVPMPETFAQSLGRQLRASGSVSRKQAQCIAKIIGRRNDWALIEDLTVEFN